MGGKSRSQSTQTTATSNQNIVNDGEYAGVGGNVTHDESVTDITNDIDNSVNQEFEIDNSVNNELDGDYAGVSGTVNHDESSTDIAYEGDFAGSSGNITMIDGGAFELAGKAIDRATDNLEKSYDFAGDTVNKSFDFGGKALNELSSTAKSAISSVERSQQTVTDFAEESIAHLSESAIDYAKNLRDAQAANMATNQQVLTAYGEDQTQQLEKISELAKNTALQGQDIVAEQAGKMVLYVTIGVVVFGIGAVLLARGN